MAVGSENWGEMDDAACRTKMVVCPVGGRAPLALAASVCSRPGHGCGRFGGGGAGVAGPPCGGCQVSVVTQPCFGLCWGGCSCTAADPDGGDGATTIRDGAAGGASRGSVTGPRRTSPHTQFWRPLGE